ncbi:MAG: twin-arginine translocase TatA/TatE family subunit [Flavipsychrobacter sp.]|nr:twin-arginine translocase TatA/TatE family subunit [Flavipsychrobacter sp.]
MLILNIPTQFLLHLPEGGQWVWILIGVIVLFGGKKIPELAKGIGKGIREFNDAKDGIKTEIENNMKEKEKAQVTTNTNPPTPPQS